MVEGPNNLLGRSTLEQSWPAEHGWLTDRTGKEFSVDLGVALPCSRPMAANEVENSNELLEACQPCVKNV